MGIGEMKYGLRKTYVVKRIVTKPEEVNVSDSSSRRISIEKETILGESYLTTRPITNTNGTGLFQGSEEAWTEDPMRASKFTFNAAAAKVYDFRTTAEITKQENTKYSVSKIMYDMEDVDLPEAE